MFLQLQLNGRDLQKIIHSEVGHSLCECPPLVNYFYSILHGNILQNCALTITCQVM